jgi:hypothetical protein
MPAVKLLLFEIRAIFLTIFFCCLDSLISLFKLNQLVLNAYEFSLETF